MKFIFVIIVSKLKFLFKNRKSVSIHYNDEGELICDEVNFIYIIVW